MSPGHLTLEFFYLSIYFGGDLGADQQHAESHGDYSSRLAWELLGNPPGGAGGCGWGEGGLDYPIRTQTSEMHQKKGYMNRSVSVLFCVLPSSGLKNVRCSLKSSKKKSQKETGPCCLMIPAQTTPFFEELLSITLSFRGSDALNQNAQALVWIQSSPVELSGGHRDRYLRCNAGPFSFATARSSHLLKEGAAPHW